MAVGTDRSRSSSPYVDRYRWTTIAWSPDGRGGVAVAAVAVAAAVAAVAVAAAVAAIAVGATGRLLNIKGDDDSGQRRQVGHNALLVVAILLGVVGRLDADAGAGQDAGTGHDWHRGGRRRELQVQHACEEGGPERKVREFAVRT
eukprot:701292-Prymnesium_polylepis.1